MGADTDRALSSEMLETIMAQSTQEQRRARWATTRNIVGFQELLNGETDDGRYSILSHLLAEELKKPPAEAFRSARITSNPVIEDLGNPLRGIFLGALMIAATMSGYLLWDNYQGGADARATLFTNQE
jgi:hypothetical protein